MTDWKDLQTRCPALGCINDQVHKRWTHGNCGGVSQINSDSDCRCVTHDQPSCILNWVFSCGHHPGEYRPISNVLGMIHAMGIASNLGTATDTVWFLKLQKNLMKAFMDRG